MEADKSKVISWPNQGPYQPSGEKAMKGTESAGPAHQELTGIIPLTQDPQTKPSGTPGNS